MKYGNMELAEIQLAFRQIRGGKVASLFSLIKDTDQSTVNYGEVRDGEEEEGGKACEQGQGGS